MKRPPPPRRPHGRSPATPPPAPQSTVELVLLSQRQIRVIFWITLAVITANWLNLQSYYSGTTQLAYWIIAASALIPLHLWAQGKVPGIPIYPAFAFFQFVAFGLPLLSSHPGITIHPPESHLSAALIVAAGLLAGTGAWVLAGNRPRAPVAVCRQLPEVNGNRILVTMIWISVLFEANTIYGWLNLPGGVFSIVRGIIGGMSILAFFILGQHLGQGRLSSGLKFAFLTGILLLLFVQTITLLLINVLSVAMIAIGGYALGAKRVPWLAIVPLVLIISFLHIGKAPVRQAYWGVNREANLGSFGDTVRMLEFWIECSNEALAEGTREQEENEKASAFQRASVMHLLLFQKDLLDNGFPHMDGTTYTIIPGLLVPRIFNPNKPWTLEGTSRMNIHFGLQTREETMVTTIGWGMINEAYANFGTLGVIAIGLLVGAATGWISYYSQGYPFLSFRSLVAILILSSTFQTEHSLGVLVTSLFQSFVGLLTFSFVFMRNMPTAEWIRFFRARTAEEKPKRRSLAT